MAETKGITIQFKGETVDIDKSIKSIDNGLKALKKESQSLNKELLKDPKNSDLLERKLKNLQSEQSLLTEKAKMYREELSKLSDKDVGSKQWATLNSKLIDVENTLKVVDQQIAKVSTAKITNLANDFGQLEKNLKSISSGLNVVGKELMKISATTLGLGTIGIKYNADIEKYKVALSGMLGSAEEADRVFAKIQERSKTSPFGVSALVEANQLLISAGENGDKSIDVIEALGNAVAGTGGGNAELSRMAQNLQQIKNVGKASSMDIKQFAMAGINIYGLLADATGKTVEQIKDMDISYELLTDALMKASQEGGRYYGAMEGQSETLSGSITKLKDSFTELLGQLTESIVPIIKDVISLLKNVTDTLKNMSPEQQAMITRIASLLVALGPIVMIGSKIFDMLGGISGAIANLLKNEKIIGLITKLTANGTSLSAILKTLFSTLTKMINPITIIIGLLVALYINSETFRNAVNGLASSVWNLVKTAFTTLANILRVVFQIIGQVLNVLKQLWLSFANSTAGQQFVQFLTNVVKLITNLINWLSKLVEWLGKVFKWFGELIGIATDFNGVTGALTTKLGKNGMSLTMQSSGLMSGGMMSNITMNNTFTITNGNDIDQRVVEHWADVMTNRINDNLGRMV